MAEGITRRNLIQAASAAGAAALLGRGASAQAAAETPLRFVHLTDMHVPLDGRREAGFTAALGAVAKLDPQPQFIITGGDHVMEAFNRPLPEVAAQWALYRRTLEAGTKLRVYPVLGNHDIWGWGIDDKSLEAQPGYGKALALEQLGLKKSYYSFDVGAWHFVMLDSLSRRGNGYFGALDAAQWEWLIGDLKSVARGRQICVVSHLPILAACVFFDGERIRPDHWQVPDAWMHRDAAELLELFRAHVVRLCISGHIHLHDVVEYDGIKFVCDGAVCGNWWKGSYHETPEGFGIFDLYADGRCMHEYKTFGWKA